MTETIRANILNEYTITRDDAEGTRLHYVVEQIRNMPDGELKAIYYMSLNDKLRESLKTTNMLLATTMDDNVVILELDIESNNTSWTVKPQWDGRLYFEMSNPIKVHEQVNE